MMTRRKFTGLLLKIPILGCAIAYFGSKTTLSVTDEAAADSLPMFLVQPLGARARAITGRTVKYIVMDDLSANARPLVQVGDCLVQEGIGEFAEILKTVECGENTITVVRPRSEDPHAGAPIRRDHLHQIN